MTDERYAEILHAWETGTVPATSISWDEWTEFSNLYVLRNK